MATIALVDDDENIVESLKAFFEARLPCARLS
jgi:FixJ family two-component response regulator